MNIPVILLLLAILLCAFILKGMAEQIEELRSENVLLWEYFDITETDSTWSELEQEAHNTIVQEIHKHINRTRFN